MTNSAGSVDSASRFEDLKVWALTKMREQHRRTLEVSSRRTYRRRQVPRSPAPQLLPASKRYKGMEWLPAGLIATQKVPKEAHLPPKYVAPYYGIGKLGWWLHGRLPLTSTMAWDPKSPWNDAFPKGPAEWGDPSDDKTFVQLRLQGPNPFMLKAAGDARTFVLDFTDLFEGVFDPTAAYFAVDSEQGLQATSITIGEQTFRPDDADNMGWETAKRVVNALDARYAAFIRHLLNTHLMVGQAFAAAAFTLPSWHPLRPYMDFFTYGCLQVNHYAYDSLLTNDSYFIRSNFLTIPDAQQIISNAMTQFDFDEWLVPRDLKKRGIEAIPGHPYVEDAQLIWPAFEQIVKRHLDDLDIDDDDIVNDPHIASWYSTLREVLPDAHTVTHLQSRSDLEDLMTALLYNNVIHEVCGNLAPILGSRDREDKVGINIDHLRSLVDPDRPTGTPRAAEVLLMDQASFVSTFNVAGNNLMTINAARYIDDPRLRDAVVRAPRDDAPA